MSRPEIKSGISLTDDGVLSITLNTELFSFELTPDELRLLGGRMLQVSDIVEARQAEAADLLHSTIGAGNA